MKNRFNPEPEIALSKLLNSWEGKESASELRKILGQNKSEELWRNIAGDANLSKDEQIRLRNMFRESLTFD
jgi:hypothetical protein